MTVLDTATYRREDLDSGPGSTSSEGRKNRRKNRRKASEDHITRGPAAALLWEALIRSGGHRSAKSGAVAARIFLAAGGDADTEALNQIEGDQMSRVR